MEQKVLRVSTAVVVGALLLRLLGAASWDFSLSPNMASWLLFLQSGRVVQAEKPSFSLPPTQPDPPPTVPTLPSLPQQTLPPATEPTPTVPTQPSAPTLPSFDPEDADAITVSSGFLWNADLPQLLSKPLVWDLTGSEPTVLILHSHTTESFTGGSYKEESPYHTLDSAHNMLSVGAYLANLLKANGISVIHDTTIHDYPSYDLSYNNSRESVQKILKQYPSIRLVLDLHRDAYEDANGNQGFQTVFSQGVELAPLMLVVGTNYGGWTHPDWQSNLSLALKLQTQLEAFCPGICRNLNLRTQRFNQDLSPGYLLVEVGSSGNTHVQAIRATEMLANAIISLARGSQ